ncbi:hypothetical protein [Roseomonas sp. 18066]|uniref:hypothetical protein n=1 Tax=Roseomonas sp. 18066 TaxID=2681412 RepID=UPI00135B91DF|nr:hypothetical protein [Roseomonas sp. 18066]
MASEIEDYPTRPDDYLPHVIARCVDKAQHHQRSFRFSLNGATVVVSPGQSAADINEEVQQQWQAAKASPPPAPLASEAERPG